MARRGPDYCRVVVITSLVWLFAMSIFMVYLLDSGPKTSGKYDSSRHEDPKRWDSDDDEHFAEKLHHEQKLNDRDNDVKHNVHNNEHVNEDRPPEHIVREPHDETVVDNDTDKDNDKDNDDDSKEVTAAERRENARVRALENRRRRQEEKRKNSEDAHNPDEPIVLTDKYEVHEDSDDPETLGILAKLMRGCLLLFVCISLLISLINVCLIIIVICRYVKCGL